MPAPPLSNTFEGGTNGVAIDTGNAGGASGDAFQGVTEGDPQSPFFSNVQARGTLSCRYTYTSTPVGPHFVSWTGLGSLTTAVYLRTYIYLPSLPSDNNFYPIGIRTNADASSAIIRILADGTIQGRDAGNSGISSGTIPIATGQWTRLEVRVISSTTVGELEWRLYNSADSVSITDTQNATGAVLGADTSRTNFGQTTANPAQPFTVYFDDLRVSTTGWIGPTAVGQTLLPDADVAEGGWTTAPLFSKVNDSSDATIITATAS